MRFSAGWRGYVELGFILLAMVLLFPFYWVYDKLFPYEKPEEP